MKNVLVRGICLVGVGLNVPAIITGLRLFAYWAHLHLSDVLYFRYKYAPAAVAWLGVSALGMGAAWFGTIKQGVYRSLLAGSVMLGLASIIVLPDVGPYSEMSLASSRLLDITENCLAAWDEAHGSYPSNDKEVAEALEVTARNERPIYFRQEAPISYTYRVTPNATGPVTSGEVPREPGTISYFVAPDKKQYWLTITALRQPVGGPVVFQCAGKYENGIVMVHGSHHLTDDEVKRRLK